MCPPGINGLFDMVREQCFNLVGVHKAAAISPAAAEAGQCLPCSFVSNRKLTCMQNAGKSSLINAMRQAAGLSTAHNITTATMPGTTLGEGPDRAAPPSPARVPGLFAGPVLRFRVHS